MCQPTSTYAERREQDNSERRRRLVFIAAGRTRSCPPSRVQSEGDAVVDAGIYTEFTVFRQLEPTKGKASAIALGRELVRFGFAIYLHTPRWRLIYAGMAPG
jgi:hypothetical protein